MEIVSIRRGFHGVKRIQTLVPSSASVPRTPAPVPALQRIHIGTAGWTIPRVHADAVDVAGAAEGSHLERYARAMNAVEINSTFYRPHQEKTFTRWAACTPDDFRFAIKAPKACTHEAKLVNCGAALAPFFAQLAPLGAKLGPILVQLPPKLAFDEGVAQEFFTTLRELHSGAVVLEPRHASWFAAKAERLLKDFEIARAMADPPAGSPLAGTPGGWPGLRYFRLHGSPRKYWSAYSDAYLRDLAGVVKDAKKSAETWVIFDNTAQNHALGNALALKKMLAAQRN